MRPLTEPETKILFTKLASYTGDSLKNLIAPMDDGDRWVFRLHKDRIYYVRLSIANLATAVARDRLLSLGVVSAGDYMLPYTSPGVPSANLFGLSPVPRKVHKIRQGPTTYVAPSNLSSPRRRCISGFCEDTKEEPEQRR